MYANGWGVKQSHAEAAKWYRRSADQGHTDGQNDLGYMYENGWGVEQSHAEALEWFGKAADQGNERAQANLGLMYEDGWGVKQSHAEAAKWFGKAADQCELCEALLTVFGLFVLQHDWVLGETWCSVFGALVFWIYPRPWYLGTCFLFPCLDKKQVASIQIPQTERRGDKRQRKKGRWGGRATGGVRGTAVQGGAGVCGVVCGGGGGMAVRGVVVCKKMAAARGFVAGGGRLWTGHWRITTCRQAAGKGQSSTSL
jgi:hypothetical protein